MNPPLVASAANILVGTSFTRHNLVSYPSDHTDKPHPALARMGPSWVALYVGSVPGCGKTGAHGPPSRPAPLLGLNGLRVSEAALANG